MNTNLQAGSHYIYDFGEDFSLSGIVLYNDGVTAIVRVTLGNFECEHFAMSYSEVQQFFPDFTDSAVSNHTKYFCLDVETEEFLLVHDIYTDVLMRYYLDDNGIWHSTYAVPEEFQDEREQRKARYENN